MQETEKENLILKDETNYNINDEVDKDERYKLTCLIHGPVYSPYKCKV